VNNETILSGRFRLIQQIGSGGMAVIYKAQDLTLGRIVAIKILRPSLTTDPAFAARFRNEARSVANLQHPNIVTVYDFALHESPQYLVMEYIDGQDLKRVIKTEGQIAIERALNFAIQICAGIGFAHRAGIVHADIKPQNVLMTRDEIPKVTDFGIAQALSTAQAGERQSVVWGSPHYFSPEQARGERPTPASDVYSIGVVMFEMLTGRTPFTGKDQRELAMAHLQAPVPMVSEVLPNVPNSLNQFIFKAMSKDPNQRYRTGDQFGNVLKSFQERERGSLASVSAGPAATIPAQQAPPVQVPPGPLYARPLDPVPTQRVDLAPVAPGTPNMGGYPAPPPPAYVPPMPAQQPSQPYSAAYQPVRPEPSRSGLDLPTIILAGLAFMSVVCLIPLYIAVFQALS